MPRLAAFLWPLVLLAGCQSRPAPPPVAAPGPVGPGMEQLMGAGVETALGLIGPASLDRREGSARLLQFGALDPTGCVLDLYYYPRAGRDVATHAEARRPDGQPIAPGACLKALTARR